MIFSKTILILLILQSTLSVNSQMQIFTDITESLQASQKGKKNLIILRTEFSTIRFSKENEYPTPCSYVDDLINTQKLQNALKNNFVIVLYDQEESSIENKMFVRQKYFYDFSPNMIILNPKAQPVAYIRLSLFDLIFDLEDMIHSSMKNFERNDKHVKGLEAKYEAKSISPNELTELIQLRSNLYLRSSAYWNYFATLNAEIPKGIEFAGETYLKEDFNHNDAFLHCLMKADKSYDDAKLQLINNLKELRYTENDVESYQYLSNIGDSLTKATLFQSDDSFGILENNMPMWQAAYEEGEIMQLIDLYKRTDHDSLLISTSEKYVHLILVEYDDRKNKLIKAHEEMLTMLKDAVISNLPPSDSTFNWDEFKSTSINNEVSSMNRQYSVDLNQIAWAYYESIEGHDNLQKAISWCKKSIELDAGMENNDTMAHLYYKMGDLENAISYQTTALSIAEQEGIRQEQLKYYSDELEKFKSR